MSFFIDSVGDGAARQ